MRLLTHFLPRVAWNTDVKYILGTASAGGNIVVWDLRQQKAWCELREPTGASFSDLSWHPEDGLVLLTGEEVAMLPVSVWFLTSKHSD